MMTQEVAQELRETAALLDAFPPSTEALRALQRTVNAVQAAQVWLVREMSERGEHEAEGCSSVKNWLRDQLHLDAADAHRLIRAGRTVTDLPDVAAAADAGTISLEHVDSFGYALKHIKAGIVIDAQDWMLQLASAAEPQQLRAATRELRNITYPDDLDDRWQRGMNKHDVHLSPVGDGFHLTGFLPASTGAKFATVLDTLSAPTCAEDDRPTSERRITALDQLLSDVLASGLPRDRGVRPHVDLTVDLTDLADNPDTTTGHLAGFGAIGPAQLQQMLCESDLTPILTSGKHAVLDVGRAVRLCTTAQRRAVRHRQDDLCAGPGCRGPVVHIHHVVYWSNGGPTDLANLIGLCPRCHSLVHAGHFTIDPGTHQINRRLTPRPARTRPRQPRAG
ncbi:DUF222 domain-containing protein [Aeromicrobium sp. CF4.19]|uniref:HNH endonuclease n=1 Tax=Aeromicrobium sp. CF4.19 TaxID=3373082 RepID=UPI003EE72E9D